MVKIAYVALLGRSEWALVNTYYAVVNNGKKPERILIVTGERHVKTLSKVVDALKEISRAYSFNPDISRLVIKDDNLQDAEERLRNLFDSLDSEGYTIELDITSGRKAMVALAVLKMARHKNGEINYLALLDRDSPNRPYMMIPAHMQRLNVFGWDSDVP
ncbi:hypothetical protein [Thermococcus sp.]|uniref:hypothetical protein n=1 Tax=Thermococcus sp. TaxID=35749 RepID=UPI0026147CD4|nr:hypothetical protein [Thermococcus sp.]